MNKQFELRKLILSVCNSDLFDEVDNFDMAKMFEELSSMFAELVEEEIENDV